MVAKAPAEQRSPAQFGMFRIGIFLNDLQQVLAAIGRETLTSRVGSLGPPRARPRLVAGALAQAG